MIQQHHHQRSLVLSQPQPQPQPRLSLPRITCFCAAPFPISSLNHSQIPRHRHSAAAASLIVSSRTKQEEEEEEDQFIEVGYISKVHGLQGQLRINSTTDFPQLRFSSPGKRWLRTRVSGKEMISEVELTGGRDHPGHKTWIISLQGIDTVDQAKQLVGSTLLVKEEDRPELEEGEFYTPDLVGMRVLLKVTGKQVGVVANVFNYGASDLLQVKLTKETTDNPDIGGQVVWIPFVEAIVPEVDLERREMLITPPKGLLELNIRKDVKSKKERRELEWKERKKLQHRYAAAKRKLSEMQQHHLLECLKVGHKTQKQLLIKQIVKINFKLFQHALQSIGMPVDRFNLSEFVHANSVMLQKNSIKISSKLLTCCVSKEALTHELHEDGLQLLTKSKAAIAFISKDEVNMQKNSQMDAISISTAETKLLHFQELILYYKGLFKEEGWNTSIPLILIAPAHEIKSFEELLLNSDYGLDSEKVWLLEEEKLPIVSLSLDNQKILMKSSYEVFQEPTGSGGVFSLLESHDISDKLIKIGVEYVQVCCLSGRPRGPAAATVGSTSTLLFGLVKRRGAAVGISIKPQGEMEENDDDEFNMVFAMDHLSRMCKQHDKLVKFWAVPEQHEHMEQVQMDDGKFVEKVHTATPKEEANSYHFCSSIYSSLSNCSFDNICILHLINSDSD